MPDPTTQSLNDIADEIASLRSKVRFAIEKLSQLERTAFVLAEHEREEIRRVISKLEAT